MSHSNSPLKSANKGRLAFLACVLGQALWSVSYLFTRVAQQSAPPLVQLSCRFTISLLIMTVPVILKPSRFDIRNGRFWPLMLFGCILPVYHFLESNGVYHTNSPFAAVVLAIFPILAMLLAAVFLKEYPTKRQVAFSFLPFLGVVLITLANSAMGAVEPIGVVFLLLCCLAGAIGRILNRKFSSTFTTFERTYNCLLVGSVVFTAAAFLTVDNAAAAYVYALSQPSFLICTLALCILCSIIADMLVNFSFTALPVVKISAISALSTSFSLFVGVVFLHEPVNAVSLLGVALTIIGIWQVNKPDKTADEAADAAPVSEDQPS